MNSTHRTMSGSKFVMGLRRGRAGAVPRSRRHTVRGFPVVAGVQLCHPGRSGERQFVCKCLRASFYRASRYQ